MNEPKSLCPSCGAALRVWHEMTPGGSCVMVRCHSFPCLNAEEGEGETLEAAVADMAAKWEKPPQP